MWQLLISEIINLTFVYLYQPPKNLNMGSFTAILLANYGGLDSLENVSQNVKNPQ